MTRLGRLWVPAAFAVLVYACWRPIVNNDLFWHLSVGARILSSHGVPRADFLSYTQLGRPWVDLEWLAETFYALVFDCAGFYGLILFKTVLLLAAALCLDAVLRRRSVPGAWRAAALLFATAALAPNNDVRPENFSLLLFAAQLWALERLPELSIAPYVPPLAAAAAYALWADLHGGFLFGLALEGCYLCGTLIGKERALVGRYGFLLLASLAGVLANPFGGGVYAVVLEHIPLAERLGGLLREWGWATFSNPLNLPYFFGLVVLLGVLLRRGGKRLSWAQGLALFGLALASARHRRMIPFFAFAEAGYLTPLLCEEAAPWGEAAVAACLAGSMLFFHFCDPLPVPFASVQPGVFPEQAATFLKKEEGSLGTLRFYNPWGWGGYLGWRLFPAYPVFENGYYLFYDQLFEEMAATDTPEHWRSFLDRHRLDLVLLKRNQPDVRMIYHHPGGPDTYDFGPYYEFFMPKERWSLVYSDDTALVFVRRERFPPGGP